MNNCESQLHWFFFFSLSLISTFSSLAIRGINNRLQIWVVFSTPNAQLFILSKTVYLLFTLHTFQHREHTRLHEAATFSNFLYTTSHRSTPSPVCRDSFTSFPLNSFFFYFTGGADILCFSPLWSSGIHVLWQNGKKKNESSVKHSGANVSRASLMYNADVFPRSEETEKHLEVVLCLCLRRSRRESDW